MKKLFTLVIISVLFTSENAQEGSATFSNDNASIQSDEIKQVERRTNTIKFDDRLVLSPNPVNEGILMIEFLAGPDTPAYIQIFDMIGVLRYSAKAFNKAPKKNEVDVSNLPSGMYICVVDIGSTRLSKSFIVQ
jgi:hypothetical protein